VKRNVKLQDGKVIEDSGPIVSTNTTEDTDKQETETTEVSLFQGYISYHIRTSVLPKYVLHLLECFLIELFTNLFISYETLETRP